MKGKIHFLWLYRHDIDIDIHPDVLFDVKIAFMFVESLQKTHFVYITRTMQCVLIMLRYEWLSATFEALITYHLVFGGFVVMLILV
ncbi:CLUMA_CG018380, isoform A [Clunio marinus]|uniref:CLUMA_CG018380, isoform A n=1 Tax=Clunio marinus TaxID=568069 RepID=A0A1J1IZA8_9DIPT|nr:CLUMA_CG018380, isoform A [Clunio marinus]